MEMIGAERQLTDGKEKEKEEGLSSQLEEFLNLYASKKFPKESRMIRVEIFFGHGQEWRVARREDHVLITFGVHPGPRLPEAIKGAVEQAVRIIRESRELDYVRNEKKGEHYIVEKDLDGQVVSEGTKELLVGPVTFKKKGQVFVVFGQMGDNPHLERGRIYKLQG